MNPWVWLGAAAVLIVVAFVMIGISPVTTIWSLLPLRMASGCLYACHRADRVKHAAPHRLRRPR